MTLSMSELGKVLVIIVCHPDVHLAIRDTFSLGLNGLCFHLPDHVGLAFRSPSVNSIAKLCVKNA